MNNLPMNHFPGVCFKLPYIINANWILIIGYVSKKIQRTFYGYTIRKEKKYKSFNLIWVFFNLNIFLWGRPQLEVQNVSKPYFLPINQFWINLLS